MSKSSLTRWPAHRRLPPFVPVRTRTRDDGWTPERQGAFIGWLAQTGSVAEAARQAGCSRESAYRLRGREDAAGFVAAWEAARAADPDVKGVRKFTPHELRGAAFRGVVQVVMRRGRYAGCTVKVSNSALIRLLTAFVRAGGRRPSQRGVR